MKKRIISVLLILLIALNSIPFINVSADEVSFSGSDFTTNATIASRLDEVFSEYVPGKHYFVSDGGDNLNGNKNYPCTARGNGCGYFSYSWQCLGYVRWAQNKLLGCDEWSNPSFGELSGYSYATEANCKNWFKTNKSKLHPGAHIRFANHSILYLSQDDNGVTFLHCNWGKTCMVKFATLSWADFANLFGYVGYCTYYKDYYNVYPEDGSATPKVPGKYKTVVPNSTLNLRAEPTTASSVLASIYDNTELVITKVQGNWGNTVFNGISGWISLDFAELIEPFTYNVKYISENTIEDSEIAFSGTIVVKSNTDPKDGYSFSGWSVQRSSDNKWYTVNGWFSDEELNNNEYEKELFTSGDRIVVNDKWIDDVTKEETFIFHPHWEEAIFGIYKVNTPDSSLNLRAEPNTSCDILDSIPHNTELDITKIQNGWGYTSYNGISGWVSLDFLEFVSPFIELESLTVHSAPNKTRYYIGEKFIATGLSLLAEYTDGTEKLVTDYSYSSSYFQSAGETDIAVSYEGMSINISVTVLPNPTITISDAYGVYGSKISVPVTVTENSYIGNGEFIIEYDSSVLEFTGYRSGEILENASITVGKGYTDEQIKISFNSNESIISAGALILLDFTVKGQPTSTTLSMNGMDLYTTSGSIAPSAFSNGNVTVFPTVTSYDKLFKSITHTVDDENIIFTVTTPATELNRVKVTLADDKGGYIKYTDSYTVNSDGDYVWSLKIPCPETATQYIFDARSDKTGKYLKEYSEYTVTDTMSSVIKSISAENSGKKTIFTVVTKAGNYSRLRVGLSEALTDNLGVTSNYTILSNGNYSWTITIPSQSEGTILYFDLRDGETNKYIKNYYEYEIDLLDDVITNVTAVKSDNKLIFTVVTQAGNYSRLRVGLNKNLTDNLAIVNKYTVNASGEYVWTITIDMPAESTTLYFDLRDAGTNKYINNYYEYKFDATVFSDEIIKSVQARKSGNKTIFTVVTASGNYSRLRVGTSETLVGNLAVSTKYTVNSVGNYEWTITVSTPAEITELYFDLRDAATNKYICQHYIYNFEV